VEGILVFPRWVSFLAEIDISPFTLDGSGADSFVGANLVFALLWSKHKVQGKGANTRFAPTKLHKYWIFPKLSAFETLMGEDQDGVIWRS